MSNYREELKKYINAAVQNQLTEHSPHASQPLWIKPTLRPHQLTLLAAAKELEGHAYADTINMADPQLITKYGIIADRVGAGKSLVALSLIKEDAPRNTTIDIKSADSHGSTILFNVKHMPPVTPFKPEWKDPALTNKDIMDNMSGGALRVYTNTALLIVPHNVCNQWETYIKEQTTLRALIIKKTKDCDYERAGFLADVFSSDVVLVSGTMLKKFVGAMSWVGPGFQRIVWSRLFIDEADSIPCALRYGEISARFMWFISGSWLNMLFPSGLQNYYISSFPPDMTELLGGGVAGVSSSYGFIYNTLCNTRDPRFTIMLLRNSEEWINKSLLQPTVGHSTILCKAPANLAILREFITPAAMEALHAGDAAAAMTALGLKATSKESLVNQVTASLRGELTQAEKILEFKHILDYSTAAAKAHAIERATQNVERLRTQLASLESRVAQATQQLCPICYDTPHTATLTPCCRQTFCLSCICECIASKPACPLCRQSVGSVKNLMVIGEGDEEAEEEKEVDPTPTKGAALLQLLATSTDSQRFLVFSAHEASFKGLREMLAARGIKCEMLMGTAARIERMRKQFQEGKIRVLCMNARHMGAGLNLQSATDVVLYHRMNAELEKQVIGRAIRFERTTELQVTHLVHDQETSFNGASSSEVIVHV
jgi:SNF2 family DNA or RNA helicase